MSAYWLLIVILVVVGMFETIRTDEIFWEAFLGAATLAGVVRILAQVKGVKPWPWT